jgi:hypothetical protein
MKVRCIQLMNPVTRIREDRSQWLSIGTLYHVLEIYLDSRGRLLLRLVGDDGLTPALHSTENFELVSPIIPANWALYFDSKGVFQIAPEAWIRPGFWEDYFDGKDEALEIFALEKAKSIACDP